jgi:RimJ/RimL family protein N-acetyltransferase
MKDSEEKIPEATLETLARNLFKETSAYGFNKVDYIRFVNYILDCAMSNQNKSKVKVKGKVEGRQEDRKELVEKSRPISLPLVGEHVKIRGFEKAKDKHLFKKWLADEYGRYFLLSRTTAKKSSIDRFIKNDFNIIGITTLLDDTPVGAVAFLNYDVMQFKAELRKLIGEPKMRGRGLGKEATSLWIQYGFETLDLKKIYLNTLDTNIRNIRLNEELGFRVEGILRNEVFVNGEYRDVLRMGLCHG